MANMQLIFPQTHMWTHTAEASRGSQHHLLAALRIICSTEAKANQFPKIIFSSIFAKPPAFHLHLCQAEKLI